VRGSSPLRRTLGWRRPPGAVDSPDEGRVRTSIATKLMFAFLGIIVLISVVFTVVGVQVFGNRVVAEAQEKVTHDLNAAREIYLGELRHVDDVIRLTAGRYYLRDNMMAGNVQATTDELRRVMVDEQLDVLTVTDPSGRVLLRAGNIPGSVGSAAGDPLVAAVLATGEAKAATQIVSAPELRQDAGDLFVKARLNVVDTPMSRPEHEPAQLDGMMLKAAAPIRDTQGTLLGVLYGGVLLNRNFKIVDKVKDTVYQNIQYEGRDIGTSTIFQGDVRISTNVLNSDGSRAIGTRVSEAVYDQVLVRGQRWIGRAFVVNDWYIAAYEPIRDIKDKVIGILYVGVLEQRYVDIRRRATITYAGIMGVGAVTSVALSYLLARRITGPLAQLVRASHQLSEGNLDTRVEIDANDEMRDLADAYNVMAAALKRRDEQLRDLAQARVMKSERLAMIGQLAAGVAHEINNPMQGIVTYSSLLLEDLPEGDPNRESAGKILTQANRCTKIVRGLLDFARARGSDQQPFDVARVLEDCIALVARQALFHNIEVVKDYQADLPLAVIDSSQMQQVFLNLIINAAEAMDGEGRLSLVTRHKRGDTHVTVQVSDTGHGITPENLDKVFVPFFTTKEAGHGTGLGLAISYNIVRAQTGTISVASEVGRGTTFTVTLPAALGDEDAPDGR
jgi:two-component system, NtrC family, sensor kinase